MVSEKRNYSSEKLAYAKNMKQRVLFASIAIPILLSIVFLPTTVPLLCLVFACIFLGTRELAGIIQNSEFKVGPFLFALVQFLCLGGVAYYFVNASFIPKHQVGCALLALFVAGVIHIWKLIRRPFDDGSVWYLFGSFWVAAPLLMLAYTHLLLDSKIYLLMLLLPLWSGDIAAIFAGKAFGKRPLAPRISPKKTWEGSIFNLAASILVAGITGSFLGIPLMHGLIIGSIIGVLGQMGDLFESLLKRTYEVKDSSQLLPGHGGILDRLDSLFFVSIPVCCYLLLLTR